MANKLLKQAQQMEKKSRSLWRKVAGPVLCTLIVPERSRVDWSHGFAFLGIF